jgi:hypothetical protein
MQLFLDDETGGVLLVSMCTFGNLIKSLKSQVVASSWVLAREVLSVVWVLVEMQAGAGKRGGTV